MTDMTRTISVLVENKPGVLARISGLFSARGYNIDSLAVGETELPDVSRMTIVARGDERILEQIIKQLNKLIDVIKVIDFSGKKYIERDLALIKLNAPKEKQTEILNILEIFRARVIDINRQGLVVEMSGTEDKIEALVEMLKPYGIVEMSRTGIIALSRSKAA